ncbi:TPA: hypothetical protein RF418_002606 [Listeria monocytogenes]|nr:hypothetical protein [Listeria monocytogenes]
MRKVYVEELSTESKNLFRKLAKEYGASEQEIQDGLDSKISDLRHDSECALGFRICENPECRELFNDGFMMENICENYCSEHCAEKAYPEIKKED